MDYLDTVSARYTNRRYNFHYFTVIVEKLLEIVRGDLQSLRICEVYSQSVIQ